VEAGSTGRLSRGQDAGQLAVYLLEGEVIAATAVSDSKLLVRAFLNHQVLDDRTARHLEQKAEKGEDVFGDLLDLGLDDVLDSAVAERFTQNLCDFVTAPGPVVFHSLPAVFANSVQIGHDTRTLVSALCDACDRVASLDPQLMVVRGETDPGDDPDGITVTAMLDAGPVAIGEIVKALPFEETRARLVLAELLEQGVVVEPPPEPPWEDDAQAEEAAASAAALEEDDTDLGPRALGTPPPAPPQPPQENGAPASFEAWLADAEEATGADDLDFFSDHDTNRGADGDGRFKTDTHHLDKVEVGTLSGEHARGTPAEAPHAGFGAPVLSEADARQKIRVANDVLSAVSAAFDIAEGMGRGRAVLQLLVDGGPSQFAPLLQDLVVSEHGALPAAGVLSNLAERPPTEHRRLLNDSLVDLIDRALSSAADELPEEQLDDVLSAIAGYRQRLGL
jgi:hypothetical protein